MITILDYCEYDLQLIIESKLKLKLLQIKLMFRRLSRALCILHDNNIINEDLKTSKILLNQKGILKICE